MNLNQQFVKFNGRINWPLVFHSSVSCQECNYHLLENIVTFFQNTTNQRLKVKVLYNTQINTSMHHYINIDCTRGLPGKLSPQEKPMSTEAKPRLTLVFEG